jgi:hypothetical protein
MKKLLKIWMCFCTVVVTVCILFFCIISIWGKVRASDNKICIINEEESFDSNGMLNRYPETSGLYRAVETNDLITIYKYAAPEIKKEVSFKSFVSSYRRDTEIKDIKILFTASQMDSVGCEYIQQILTYKSRRAYSPGIGQSYGAIRWRKTADAICFVTFPFPISISSEFGSFPMHIKY